MLRVLNQIQTVRTHTRKNLT